MLQHDEELSLLQAQMVYKKRLEAVMHELTGQEAALLEKTRQLKESMLQEQKDVQRLEKHSLSAVFYQLTGQMTAMMDKERREACAARIKYETALRELEAIREDIRETREDLKDLQNCEEAYARKLEEKRRSMEASSDPEGARLLQQDQHLSYLTQQEQELAEAITAGTSALRTMAQLQQNLNSAKDWSAGDKPLVFWADHARKDKMDEALENVADLQVQMQKFNRELSDVTIRPSLQPSIQRMLTFADSLFDRLLEDKPIPERVQTGCALADQTRECILGVLRQLQNTMEEVRHKRVRLRTEMDELVLRTVNQ